MARKTASEKAMDRFADELRAEGYSVRNGGWPNSLVEEAKWDFCRTKLTIFPMTDRAREHFKKRVAEGR